MRYSILSALVVVWFIHQIHASIQLGKDDELKDLDVIWPTSLAHDQPQALQLLVGLEHTSPSVATFNVSLNAQENRASFTSVSSCPQFDKVINFRSCEDSCEDSSRSTCEMQCRELRKLRSGYKDGSCQDEARFSGVLSVSTDPLKAVTWVCDKMNQRISAIDRTTGTVSTPFHLNKTFVPERISKPIIDDWLYVTGYSRQSPELVIYELNTQTHTKELMYRRTNHHGAFHAVDYAVTILNGSQLAVCSAQQHTFIVPTSRGRSNFVHDQDTVVRLKDIQACHALAYDPEAHDLFVFENTASPGPEAGMMTRLHYSEATGTFHRKLQVSLGVLGIHGASTVKRIHSAQHFFLAATYETLVYSCRLFHGRVFCKRAHTNSLVITRPSASHNALGRSGHSKGRENGPRITDVIGGESSPPNSSSSQASQQPIKLGEEPEETSKRQEGASSPKPVQHQRHKHQQTSLSKQISVARAKQIASEQ